MNKGNMIIEGKLTVFISTPHIFLVPTCLCLGRPGFWLSYCVTLEQLSSVLHAALVCVWEH